MFRFDFSLIESENSLNSNSNNCNNSNCDGLEWLPAKVISPDNYTEIKISEEWESLNVNGYWLYHIKSSAISTFIESRNDLTSTDIIPSKYEGGLKVWDCTHHLLQFLTNGSNQIEFKNKTVLDLGCGNGLLGILAISLGASAVDFQDYNEEVIKITTFPSVLKNLEQTGTSKSLCKYYSGDWMSFSELIQEEYDIILTSATIYNTCNYKKLLSVFKKGLKQDGIILVAAKTYYFGNGGGTRQFEEALIKDGNFCSAVLWKSNEGVQQEILKVTFINK